MAGVLSLALVVYILAFLLGVIGISIKPPEGVAGATRNREPRPKRCVSDPRPRGDIKPGETGEIEPGKRSGRETIKYALIRAFFKGFLFCMTIPRS